MHNLPLFIKRLRKKACGVGVDFIFNEKFKELLYKDNKISGLVTESGLIVNAKLVVDASGIPSVVRKQINSPFMETFTIGPKDMFYVLLKYVKLTDKNNKVELSTSLC